MGCTMTEENKAGAEPIALTGEEEWFPPAEDDAEARLKQAGPGGVRGVFYGMDGLRAGWSLLLFVTLVFGIARAVGWLVKHLLGPSPHVKEQSALVVVLAEAATFLALAGAAWLVSLVEQRRFARYGLDAPVGRRLTQFAVGCVTGFVLLSVLVLLLKVSGLLVFDGMLLSGAAVVQWAAAWALGFLGVGLAEEFATRAFVQFTLARGLAGIAGALGVGARTRQVFGFWATALFFSFLFGFGHKGNVGESPIGLLSAGLIGLVFAFSLWRTGSLWWAVGFHAAWDWAQSFVYGVADSGQMVQHHLMASHPVGSPLMSGGLTGPEGSVYVLGAIALTAVAIFVMLPSEAGSPSDATYSPNA